MRPRGLRCAGALLFALTVSGVIASQAPDHPLPSRTPGRFQRKVLVSTRPVTTTPVSDTPAPTPIPPSVTPKQPSSPAPSSAPESASSPAPSSAPETSSTPAPSPDSAEETAPSAIVADKATSSGGSRSARSAAAAAQDRWMRYVEDYASGADMGGGVPNWSRTPIKLELPVVEGKGSRSSVVPVFVLPVPLPLPLPARSECSADRDRPLNEPRRRKPAVDSYPRRYEESPRRDGLPWTIDYDESHRPTGFNKPGRPFNKDRLYYDDRQVPGYFEPHRPDYDRSDYDEPPRRPSYKEPPRRPTYEEPPRRPPGDGAHGRPVPHQEPPPAPVPDVYGRPRPRPFLKPESVPSYIHPPTMHSGEPVSSDVLLELFRAQQPRAPHLPPVLTRHRRNVEPAPPAPPTHDARSPPSQQPSPPRPRFERPLAVRGELTVHRADYTEPYTAWWDPVTGNSRVDFHDGATKTFRMMQQGQVRRVAMSYDRTGEKDVLRCATMQGPVTPHDLLPNMLPAMEPFSFHGHVQMGDVLAERWRHQETVPSDLQGEQLTYHHDMFVARSGNDTVNPMMYMVRVDSSVLGEGSDRYTHRYHEVRQQLHDEHTFTFDIGKQCDTSDETADMSVVEPLREFTMPRRDPRHDDFFEKFSVEYERHYVDHVEKAIRKNLLTQTSRFVSAGNRMGASFEMGVNFLSDRLQAEVDILLGVEHDTEHFPSEQFPHERGALRELADRLPDRFDWRERGGVSPVKYQGSCSSCWAFAVTGAVEGALFRKTRRLVPLSEQCLVDCAQPYGGNGCKGTWPSHAYDYVQDRGLPAEKEYIPYQARVLECQDKRVKPVTQISAHVNVTQHSVPALKLAIRRHAPSVVIIDSSPMSFVTYKKGIFYDDRCNKMRKKLKHAVLAVGWGTQRSEPHFILKNSWSDAWGEAGFVRMHGPSNTCGVLTLPSYPRLERADVLRDPSPAPAPAPAARTAASEPAATPAAGDDDYD